MKNILVLVVLVGLVACGRREIKTTEYMTVTDTKALAELNAKVDSLNADLAQAQADLSTLDDKVDALESAGMHVTEVIDPCGDMPNQYDEVLIRLSSGQIVAFFEGANNTRFLSVLGDGAYITTDVQKCRFDVVKGKIVLK